jgi:anti-sigma-K factor RsiG
MDEQTRRRLDKMFDPEFVDGLPSTPDNELRFRLRESREEEEELSFVRRLLHARLDILKAELDARRGGRGTARGLEVLQDALTEGSGPTNRGARAPIGTRFTISAGRRRAERIVSDDHLARLPDLDFNEIENVIGRATDEERRVSEERKRLHDVIDALEAELADRYRAGLAPPV